MNRRARIPALLIAGAVLAAGCGERGAESAKGNKGALYHYRLAAEKYREGEFDEAIGIYEKALQLNPRMAEAHLDLGIIYDDYKCSREKAIEHYREFLALEPRSEKADMVRKWIERAAESGDVSPQPGPADAAAAEGGAGASGAQGDQQRLREDMAVLRAENEAYLKTVEALRNELTQARREGAAAAEAPPASADAWAVEKARLWERYRSERGRFDKTLETLREEVAHLQAQKAASDEALKQLRAQGEAGRTGTPAPASGEGELARSAQRIRELQAQGDAGRQERETLQAKLRDAEKKLQSYRMQAPSDSPILLAKVKADSEREREELKKSYEKKIGDLLAGLSRERAEAQRELAEARRAAQRAQAAAPRPAATPEPSARMRAEVEHETAEIRQRYERRISEAAAAAERDRAAAQRELTQARREAAYNKSQYEKEREKTGKAEQYQATAIGRLREQFRREKIEMEQRFRAEKEQILARVSAARPKEAPVPIPPPAKPAAPAPAPATKWVEPGARKPATPARRYRTVKGDTLRSLALRFYGSSGRWKSIQDANRGALAGQNPSGALKPGLVLNIP